VHEIVQEMLSARAIRRRSTPASGSRPKKFTPSC